MISFLICAFHEERNIQETVETIYKAIDKTNVKDAYQIVIINDGGDDYTEKVVHELQLSDKNISYYKNEKNLGYGKSVVLGLTKIRHSKFMIVPGDNDISSDALIAALQHINSADLIMVFPINIDSRSKIRNIILVLFRLIYLIFFDCYVNYINSPSICPTEKVKSLKLQSSRFSIISEILTKLLHSDITYCEVPAFWHTSLRKRKTVTIKNLYDTIASFIKLFIEMKISNKNNFTGKSERKNIY